jgi:FtsH-binding integral membrane protein
MTSTSHESHEAAQAPARPGIAANPAVERAFIARVYGWMAIGLGITGLVAVATASDPALMGWIINTPLILMVIAVQLLIVVVLGGAIRRLNAGIATGLFIGYAALTGLTFSSLFYVYTTESIASVFFVTAVTFGLLSAYGLLTKTDLTWLGNLALMALVGIILASSVNLFLGSEVIFWIATYAGVVVFVILIASETQQIKRMAYGLSKDGELRSKASVIAAMSLYLSFIGLFLRLLRISGKRR